MDTQPHCVCNVDIHGHVAVSHLRSRQIDDQIKLHLSTLLPKSRHDQLLFFFHF